MALSIPSYPDPRDPETLLAPAYAWMSGLSLDLRAGTGRVLLSIHPRESAWEARPVDQFGVALGQPLGPGAAFPTLEALMADPEFAAAYQVIGAKLYAALAATHPAFAGSVQV